MSEYIPWIPPERKKYSEPLEVVTEPEGKIENLKYEWKKIQFGKTQLG